MVKVLVSDPISDKGLEVLESAGFDIVYHPNPSTDELQSLVSDIGAWIVRSGTKVTSELLKDARNLQVVGRAGVGIDNIDIEAATLNGVLVMNTPDGNSITTAEHTIAMIMSLARKIPAADASNLHLSALLSPLSA